MSVKIPVVAVIAAIGSMLTSTAPTLAQSSFAPCPASTYPGLTFGPGVPSYSVGMVNGLCYCGVWTNVTPSQAQQQGWYASCNAGKGICNYAPGTRASNQVCKP
jgi:hypothetical protein